MTWFSFTNGPKRARWFRPSLEDLECRNLPSTLTVLNNADRGAGSLRDTIAAAGSGDKIVFDPSLDGQTITLTSGELLIQQSLTIQGPGADQLTVSGSGTSRVFDLTGSGTSAAITGLTIADGVAVQGGAIENTASNLTLASDVLSGNAALGSTGNDAQGGAIFNGSAATIGVRNCAFVNNQAQGGDGLSGASAGSGYGGVLFNAGSGTFNHDTLSDNAAIGGASTGLGGSGFGGAIWNDAGGVLTIRDGSFLANQAIGGVHGKVADTPFGSVGDGGAVFNAGTLDVQDSGFDGNQSHGGAGLAGATGGGGASAAIKSGGEDDDPPAQTTVRDCFFSNNQAMGGAGGAGAVGGQGNGGAFLADHGTDTLSDCAFLDNLAIGGAGGAGANGGAGRAGGLRLGPRDGSVSVLVTDCLFAGNKAIGGAAGSGAVGGVGEGGGIGNIQITANSYTSALTIRDSVVAGNEALGGAGLIGGAAHGGGIAVDGGPTLTSGGITLTVIDSFVASNTAQGADGGAGNGGNGLGGGLFVDATATLTVAGTTITGNTATGGQGAAGFSNGKGQGGGIYIAAGGNACADDATAVDGNSASTSNDNVFGILETC